MAGRLRRTSPLWTKSSNVGAVPVSGPGLKRTKAARPERARRGGPASSKRSRRASPRRRGGRRSRGKLADDWGDLELLTAHRAARDGSSRSSRPLETLFRAGASRALGAVPRRRSELGLLSGRSLSDPSTLVAQPPHRPQPRPDRRDPRSRGCPSTSTSRRRTRSAARRLHEIPELIRVAAPVYVKFGLRNAPTSTPTWRRRSPPTLTARSAARLQRRASPFRCRDCPTIRRRGLRPRVTRRSRSGRPRPPSAAGRPAATHAGGELERLLLVKPSSPSAVPSPARSTSVRRAPPTATLLRPAAPPAPRNEPGRP